jgi:hypothetical protein
VGCRLLVLLQVWHNGKIGGDFKDNRYRAAVKRVDRVQHVRRQRQAQRPCGTIALDQRHAEETQKGNLDGMPASILDIRGGERHPHKLSVAETGCTEATRVAKEPCAGAGGVARPCVRLCPMTAGRAWFRGRWLFWPVVLACAVGGAAAGS